MCVHIYACVFVYKHACITLYICIVCPFMYLYVNVCAFCILIMYLFINLHVICGHLIIQLHLELLRYLLLLCRFILHRDLWNLTRPNSISWHNSIIWPNSLTWPNSLIGLMQWHLKSHRQSAIFSMEARITMFVSMFVSQSACLYACVGWRELVGETGGSRKQRERLSPCLQKTMCYRVSSSQVLHGFRRQS